MTPERKAELRNREVITLGDPRWMRVNAALDEALDALEVAERERDEARRTIERAGEELDAMFREGPYPDIAWPDVAWQAAVRRVRRALSPTAAPKEEG